AIAPAGSLEQNLALVGKARAQLNLNDRAGAAATVAGVPTAFNYLILHSSNTSRQENGVYAYTIDSGRYGVANLEGGNGLPFITEGETDGPIHDPRIPNNNTRPGFDPSITDPFYSQLKYPSRDTDVPLANGTEARLIQAEAALNGGASNTYLTILNTLRTSAGLPALADPGTPAGRVNQFFKERAYFLWLTSHRLGDLRRLIRQYGRTEDDVFPTGTYFRGGLYGNDVNLPIFVDEGNNPNFTGCVNRGA
ncbi:MAG TPA: RagB/SusD family nutrient uptake outer membrane protein, partial [Longimicrobium sp.]